MFKNDLVRLKSTGAVGVVTDTVNPLFPTVLFDGKDPENVCVVLLDLVNEQPNIEFSPGVYVSHTWNRYYADKLGEVEDELSFLVTSEEDDLEEEEDDWEDEDDEDLDDDYYEEMY